MRCLTLCAALASILVGCATSEPSRSLYQWTDEAGSVRYTAFPDRIPSSQAHTQQVVEPGGSASQTASVPSGPFPPAAPQAPRPPPPAADPLDARIAELEARVAADEETLKALISDPKLADKLRSSPELREVGTRLPALQAELEELRQERAARDGS